MSKQRHGSETPATAWLRRQGVPFTDHVYDYVEHGGTAESARQLGVAGLRPQASTTSSRRS